MNRFNIPCENCVKPDCYDCGSGLYDEIWEQRMAIDREPSEQFLEIMFGEDI